jgi:hypothetical protein
MDRSVSNVCQDAPPPPRFTIWVNGKNESGCRTFVQRLFPSPGVCRATGELFPDVRRFFPSDWRLDGLSAHSSCVRRGGLPFAPPAGYAKDSNSGIHSSLMLIERGKYRCALLRREALRGRETTNRVNLWNSPRHGLRRAPASARGTKRPVALLWRR